MDFTVAIYRKLLQSFIENKYTFQTYSEFVENPLDKVILLRHDVDDRKNNSLTFARIQNELGIKGTYYFRMVPQSFDENVIKEIYDLGHEVGYHYEDMDFTNGDADKAILLFDEHLKKLRGIVPVSTICMHGSPKSKYDNKDVWKKYNYQDYGIIAEPYFDLNFDQTFYLTDTGRMWDGFKVSVRDKVQTSVKWPTYHSTQQVINAIQSGDFPQQVMMNFHPQRWTDNKVQWIKEGLIQAVKNQVKRVLILRKK